MILRVFIFGVVTILAIAHHSAGQVRAIKSASATRSFEVGRGGSSGSTSGFLAEFFLQLMFGEVVYQQQRKLEQIHEIPSLVSVELLLQGAGQPSSYYILNPRLRANWGLFSTDFRFNYILEEDIDGIQYLRTNDWQIVQLNLVTTRDLTFRVGGGFLQEAFAERKSYPEWTGGVHIRPFSSKLGGVIEYRVSEARNEVNGHIRYAFFEKKRLYGYLTAGVVFQRHYREVNVWGFQSGFAFSIF